MQHPTHDSHPYLRLGLGFAMHRRVRFRVRIKARVRFRIRVRVSVLGFKCCLGLVTHDGVLFESCPTH